MIEHTLGAALAALAEVWTKLRAEIWKNEGKQYPSGSISTVSVLLKQHSFPPRRAHIYGFIQNLPEPGVTITPDVECFLVYSGFEMQKNDI